MTAKMSQDRADAILDKLISDCADWFVDEWPDLCKRAIRQNTEQDTPDSVVADAITWIMQDQRETFLADVAKRIKMSWRKSLGGTPL